MIFEERIEKMLQSKPNGDREVRIPSYLTFLNTLKYILNQITEPDIHLTTNEISKAVEFALAESEKQAKK
jgi:hypothetical protein